MTAYIKFYKTNKEVKKNFVWTIAEAQQNLSKKDFEKLMSWEGVSNSRIIGYIK